MIEVIADRHEVKARREHICDECNGKILSGERYLTATYKYDDVYSWKQHLECAEFQKKHGAIFEDDDTGRPPIMYWEDGYLSDEIWQERAGILKKAGWKTKPANKRPEGTE